MIDAFVLPVEALEEEEQCKFDKPWVLLFPDSTAKEYDSENDACDAQMVYRLTNGLCVYTGKQL